MATPEAVNDSPVGPQVHDAGLHADEAQCPYCGQPISRKEFKEIQARIEAEGRERVAKVEQALKHRFVREQQQAEAKAKIAVEQARREATKIAEQQIKTLRANQETVIAARVKVQREASEKKLAEAVNAERAKHFGEKLKLEEQLQEMQRRLQKKTANELGDEGEVDLFEELRREFANDQIERVKKGKEGGDILHRIVGQNGQICGKIVYDVKNTSRFMSKYLTKLRADQLREEADHAVLSTRAFPSGTQQLAVVNGVVIAHPARAVAVASLLRRQVIQVHALRLGKEGREQKAQSLYAFMISPRATALWDEIAKATEGLRALDLSEKTAHEKTWGRRADLIRAVQGVHDEFSAAIDRIIGGAEASL
jgi:hypothetical protein